MGEPRGWVGQRMGELGRASERGSSELTKLARGESAVTVAEAGVIDRKDR